MKKMTKKEGREYLRRWKGVQRFMVHELRTLTYSQKLGQFFLLFSARDFFRFPQETSEDEKVRSRWAQLRRHFGYV